MHITFGSVHDLGDFGFSDFEGVNTAGADPRLVHIEHDLRRLFLRFLEDAHQDRDDEFHRRIIIIHQQNAIHGRFFGLFARLGDDTAFHVIIGPVIGVSRTPIRALIRTGQYNSCHRVEHYSHLLWQRAAFEKSSTRQSHPLCAVPLRITPDFVATRLRHVNLSLTAPAYRFAMNWVRLAIIAIALCVAAPAHAEQQGRYASIIVDANSLDILHARQIDAQRHPASLTKIMTLYLTFEALETGQLTLDKAVPVSANAASTAPVKMGLKRGQKVRIDTLIQAVAVRSSNDAAVVLAEAVGGSEPQFVDRMNATALALGMRRTTFRNPHGLPDGAQVTTARDMAKLAIATRTRFPQHYHYFGQTHFRGRESTNKLLKTRTDVDGFKTGYTRASGFNLVISAVRDETRIIAVVLGGASSGSRNSHMSTLIDRGFDVLSMQNKPVIAARAPTAIPVHRRQWAMQIDGFTSPAETEIYADALIRNAKIGAAIPRSRTHGERTSHSVRIEALDQATARNLCTHHGELLGITPRRCKVLSIANSG